MVMLEFQRCAGSGITVTCVVAIPEEKLIIANSIANIKFITEMPTQLGAVRAGLY